MEKENANMMLVDVVIHPQGDSPDRIGVALWAPASRGPTLWVPCALRCPPQEVRKMSSHTLEIQGESQY